MKMLLSAEVVAGVTPSTTALLHIVGVEQFVPVVVVVAEHDDVVSLDRQSGKVGVAHAGYAAEAAPVVGGVSRIYAV